MTAAVARQERHADAREPAEHQRIGGSAERGTNAHLARIFEAGHLVEAAAADHAEPHPGCAPLLGSRSHGCGPSRGGGPAMQLRGRCTLRSLSKPDYRKA